MGEFLVDDGVDLIAEPCSVEPFVLIEQMETVGGVPFTGGLRQPFELARWEKVRKVLEHESNCRQDGKIDRSERHAINVSSGAASSHRT
jgi:hypothetical protein